MKEEQYKEAHNAFVEEYKLKAGDTIKILRSAKSHEMGWGPVWNKKYMDPMVGQEYKVCDINKYNGIQVDNEGHTKYWFPWFVVEKTKDEFSPIVIKNITSDYDASIQEDGSVKVGCQTVTFEKLEQLFKAASKIKGL